MDKKPNCFSLNSRTVKQKLMVAFQLMFILPFLVCIYLLSTYIFSKSGIKLDIVIYLVVSAFLAIVGLLVIKEVFDRLTSVTTVAKSIAAGDISRELQVEHSDEVGELGNILNQLTHRIRSNMDELEGYSAKTTVINIEIQKKIIVLSNLMQLSTLISQGSKFDEVLKIAVEKSRSLADSENAFLLFKDELKNSFSMKVADGIKADYLMAVEIGPQEDLYHKAFNSNKLLILDKQNSLPDNLTVDFLAKFQVKNCLAMPIFLRGMVKAVLGIANNRDKFSYNKGDIELLDIFSKQIAVAIENDILAHRIEKLEIKDTLTGLYNRFFIKSRLQEEIKRAIVYQRPCAFVIFDIDNFKNYFEKFGLIHGEAALKKIAVLIRGCITEVDRAGRTDYDEFSLILPEKNKRQAQEVAEEICKKIQASFCVDEDSSKCLTFSAGVSENPLDGVEVEQLITKAKELLKKAKAGGKNKVVVS
ncbi:MAG: diguanylate cyclase [Candidatus Omnitrophica bacterium]|nr:diguanylate cyclase [Candidatus Omnitrophota bacterium]MBU4303357.1 diguanylate cyclase [Candidatus Omnitrophota bacterium]MBU4467579.1 diguanylate cyclase [Candidatus Omnitrophota bacterium]MCG2707228.1 diguanylate cyclase [Candidatus Omnitrophota bacterium]